jgi:hypothetical protein
MAGPWIAPGDPALRHDLQLLADAGVITTPMTAWPLSWGSVSQDLNGVVDKNALNVAEYAAMGRVKARMRAETPVEEVMLEAEVAVAEKPTRVREFLDTPRGDAQARVAADWTGNRFAARVEVTAVADDPVDDKEVRLDGSYVAFAIGNWMVAAGAMDRWWGPGWEGSLILSTNGRAIPSLSVQRNFPDPFKLPWLRWVGPWSTSIVFGQLESSRAVPDARFFAWQLNFKPTPKLEIGLERTAQWCGEGRPCGLDTFFNLLIGRDNRGEGGTTIGNEPGNQLGGVSVRYASPIGDLPYALYLQVTGEDEAGGLPSKLLGLFGVEHWGLWGGKSYRVHAEVTDTSCSFANDPEFNCAYESSIYQTGYRYRGRSIGHSLEQDARGVSIGGLVIPEQGREWRGTLRFAKLNRGGAPSPTNTLTPTAKDLINIEVSHQRATPWGLLEVGAGVDRLDDAVAGGSQTDARAFLRWQQDF